MHWNREINENLFFEIIIWIHVLNSTRVMSKTARTLLRSTCSATKEKPFVLMATTMIRTAGDDDDEVAPGQQVVLEDWQSSRPAVLRTSSLLCRAYARPLQIMIYIDLIYVHVHIRCTCICTCYTSGNKRSQTGRDWLKSLWSAEPTLDLESKSEEKVIFSLMDELAVFF